MIPRINPRGSLSVPHNCTMNRSHKLKTFSKLSVIALDHSVGGKMAEV